MRHGGFYLNGHRLTIGGGGLNIYQNVGQPQIHGGGLLTSSTVSLNFNIKARLQTGFSIASEIADNPHHKVDLRISGGAVGYESHIDFIGAVSNSFTGDIHISGHAGLLLYKDNGAMAVRGNIVVSDSGYLEVIKSDQISDTSTVILKGNRSGIAPVLNFGRESNWHITEKINRFVVETHGAINFAGIRGPHYNRFFYLNDLEVTWASELIVRAWALGRDHLLVRKDSEHLNDALSRIKFEGYKEWRAALKSYNKDYWQLIPGVPEPSTYGAVLGAVGVGLFLLRRRVPVCGLNVVGFFCPWRCSKLSRLPESGFSRCESCRL